jgi:effector-binding domain-containing protein
VIAAIHVINAVPRPLAVVRVTTLLSRWPAEFRKSLDQVYAALKTGAFRQSGHNVMIYRNRHDGLVDIECGIEIENRFEPAGEALYSETPSGLAVTATHIGTYEKLGSSYRALEDWSSANGRQLTKTCWEIYGDWESDPANLRTEIFLLVQP